MNKEDYSNAIGIDLGTKNSCVGIYNHKTESVVIIPNENGSRTTPSYVAFLDGQRLVGDEAKNVSHLYPKSVIYDIKRFMGKKLYDDGVQDDISHMPYDIIHDNNGKLLVSCQNYDTYEDKVTQMKNYHASEISAIILEKMKDISTNYLGFEVKNAVITVPAYFNDAQRSATKDSAIIAGLNPLRIINEPTSASLCYGFEGQDGTILVFDLGGGTFDVSVLEIRSGVFNVLSTNGNTHLGGEDFDRRLVTLFLKKIEDHGIKLSETDDDYFNIMGKLKELSEKTKKNLSIKLVERITIEIRNKVINFNLSRKMFEDICEDLFIMIKEPVNIAISDAGLQKEEIDQIVLVGGSTRIPKICNMLEDMFDGKQLNRKINPDEAVSYGACIQGAILSKSDFGKNGKTKDIVLVDVIPLSLGIKGHNGTMSKIIMKNSSIPVTSKQLYTTTEDNQESVLVEVYEGEREFVCDNHLLNKFELSNLQKAVRGVPKIEVQFNVDENGILNVTATDLKTLQISKIEISNDHGLTDEEIQRMIKDAEKNREVDSLRREVIEYTQNFNDYLDSVLRDVNNTDALTQEELSDINQLIMNNKDWLDEGGHNKEELVQCRETMKYYIDPILNKVYSIKSNTITDNVSNASNASNSISNTGVFDLQDIKDNLDKLL